ncbi:MAG: multidrug efflux MFS transporter [Lachnospiraceae bacterium]|nr:multidrug efflux MFS transporter [Lachnospiraceae bacterium]
MIFGDLIVSGIATSILSTAMTTALPSLMEDFGVSTDIGQWATSGYSLAMGMVMPLTAFLITRFPTKKLYMTAIGGFIIGLLCSIFAGNFWLMMAGRVLQACGNGVLVSAAQVIILTVYPAEKKGTMMGTYGLATTAAPIIAPTLLTWGTSNVDPKKVADASSLLTAFRTIAGSIGSAVFVGIMTVVSNGSAAVYGEDALIHGMNISFFWMAVGSLALLMIAVLGVRDGERQRE